MVLAAYLVPFADGCTPGAQWALRLAMATVFSHGGHYLLCGEGNGVLTHPYYPNFARVDEPTCGSCATCSTSRSRTATCCTHPRDGP